MLDKFIELVKEEKDGFTIDKPWRLNEKSLSVIVPILRKTDEKRDYITLSEAKKIKVEDTGQIDYVFVKNLEDMPVLISRGEIFRGKTQERTAVHDHIVLPNESLRVSVRCVHQSKGINFGANMEYGGRTPYDIDLSKQAKTWETIRGYTTGIDPNYINYYNHEKNINVTEFNAFQTTVNHHVTGRISSSESGSSGPSISSPSDDLVSTMDGLTESIKEAMKKIPYIDNQVGAVFFKENSIVGLDIYNIPASWDAVKKDIVEKEGASFIEKDDDEMFEFNFREGKAKQHLKNKLEDEFKTTPIYDKDYTVVEIRSDSLVGEGIIFKDKVIHLTMWKCK